MSEHSVSVEVAHKLQERKHAKRSHKEEVRRFEERIEIIEAVLLAVVAIATAWSGYQSARWDGRSAESYAVASAHRVDSDNFFTLGGQQRLHDISTFNAWLQAKASGNDQMAEMLERRFSANYKTAFNAWVATDPFNNPEAPAGPAFMAEYVNDLEQQGESMRSDASHTLELGRTERETGEDYVRLTVFLATILFMVAISQRFRSNVPRFGLLGLAGLATAVTLTMLMMFPRG